MDTPVIEQLSEVQARGQRCRAWLSLETTEEFLRPLKEKAANLKEIDFNKIRTLDDKSFRSKVEARFLAAQEIGDYLNLIADIVSAGDQATKSLEGTDTDIY